MELIINLFGNDYKCREFFDIVGTSTEISGIEVFNNDVRIGSMVGISLPDSTDENEMNKFKSDLEYWLIENE